MHPHTWHTHTLTNIHMQINRQTDRQIDINDIFRKKKGIVDNKQKKIYLDFYIAS